VHPCSVADGAPRRVVGEQDCFLRHGLLGRAVQDTLGVDVQVLPGAGHLAVEEQPQAVAAALADVSVRIAPRA
jgi:pimeloyl-ACP methyl ester carboxylesterase